MEIRVPRTEIEWSRRAIINVVAVLAAHSESLTLVGAHAVLLRTMDLMRRGCLPVTAIWA